MSFKFQTRAWSEEHATVVRGMYAIDGSTKLTVRGRYGILGDPTVSLAGMGEVPAPGNVFIMNYDDCEGAVTSLQDAGVIGRTVRIIETHAHTRNPLRQRPVHECPLLDGHDD